MSQDPIRYLRSQPLWVRKGITWSGTALVAAFLLMWLVHDMGGKLSAAQQSAEDITQGAKTQLQQSFDKASADAPSLNIPSPSPLSSADQQALEELQNQLQGSPSPNVSASPSTSPLSEQAAEPTLSPTPVHNVSRSDAGGPTP